MKYLIIGGAGYHRTYTGTGVCTGLRIIGHTDSKNQIKHIVDEFYGNCGGLMIVIDTETGVEFTE